MKMGNKVLIPCAVLLLSISIVPSLLANHEGAGKPSKTEVLQKTKKLQIPFIANDGQMDEQVRFYANTFGGTVFVTKDGEIVYSLPGRDKGQETAVGCWGSAVGEGGYGPRIPLEHPEEHVGWIKALSFAPYPPTLFPYQLDSLAPNRSTERSRRSPSFTTSNDNEARTNGRGVLQYALTCLRERDRVRGISLKEGLVGGKISGITGEGPSVTKVNYFKGNDPSKWKSNIPTYVYVNLGEVYEGIGLRLKAYGNNVEKLFCVKPGANPDQIKIRLDGIQPPGNPPPIPVSGGQPPVPLTEGDKGGGVSATSLLEKGTTPIFFLTKGTTPVFSLVTSISNLLKETQPPESPFIKGDLTKSPFDKGEHCGNSPLTKDATTNSPLTKGARGLSINEHGELVVETEFGPVKFTKPVAYQEIDGKRVEVRAEYVIRDREPSAVKDSKNANMDNGHDQWSIYGFKVAAYDKTKELIIDPLLASTYLGGSDFDEAISIAIDSGGYICVTGNTDSSGFPTTPDTYDISYNDVLQDDYDGDVFVSRLSGDLTSLIASTYLGGSRHDYVNSIAIDSVGNIYVAGVTNSPDFPTTPGAYDTSYNYDTLYNNGGDGFVSRLSGDLTSLLASTYLGGSNPEYVNSLAIDSGGNIYVTGNIGSLDFPITPGAYDASYNGGSDGFVSRLSGDLTSLLASTYLGGSSHEYVNSLAIDSGGNIYVTGGTWSSDFPTTPGAYDTSLNGYFRGFVSQLSGDLTNLLASTYLGESYSYSDSVSSIAIDAGGNIYVAGVTNSSDFPTTPGAYDTSFNSSKTDEYGSYIYVDAFVSKLNGALTSLLASTYLGGYYRDHANSIVIDSGGNIYVAGVTESSDFPTTPGAYDTSYNNGGDGFVSRLSGDLTNLLASTYLRGSGNDHANSIAIDSGGNIYVAGVTESSDFPTTPGAYDTSYNRFSDGFVSRFDSNLSPSVDMVFTVKSSSNNIRSNETVTISGTVTLKPDDEATREKFLKKKVKLFRISPTGSYKEILTAKPFEPDSLLHYKFKDVRFPEIGTWKVYVFYDDGDDFRGTTSETLEIDVGSEQKPVTGYAILTEGKYEGGLGIDAYNLTTNDIYKKLLKMGFTAKNIYYFNFDDTQEGVDEIPDKEKILDAIEKWAKKKMNKKAAPLYIIFAGPGEEETLFIGSETLTASDLSKSLKNLEAGLNPEASKKDIVVILGVNRSGSFINDLSRSDTKRIIITSADTEEVACQGPLAPDETIRQGDYFVSEFFRYAAMGMNVKGCYEKAADTIAVFTNNKNGNGLYGAWAGNGNYFDNAAQHPLIDDDGDKVGTARVFLTYNGDDGEHSSKLIIGKGGTPSLEFTRVTDVVTLEAGDTTPELFAEISDTSESNKAWVEIVPSQYGLENDKESREQQVVDLPRYNPTGFDEENRRYTWNSFTSADFEAPGTYGIFYFAEDAKTGDITTIVTSDVYKKIDNSDLQGQYLLNLPKDNGTTSVALTFDWTSAGQDENAHVTYSLTISESPTFDTVYYQQKGITENNVFVDLSAGLLSGATYYWRVLVSDDEGRTKFIERFEGDGSEGALHKGISSVLSEGNKENGFTAEAGSFYLIPKIEGYVYDKITGEKIEGSKVIVQEKNGAWKTDPPLETNKKGYYESFLPSGGKYTISAGSSGYKEGKETINAKSGQKKLVNMKMEKEP